MARMLRLRRPGMDYEIRVVGMQPTPLRDFYHLLLRQGWPATLATIGIGYLLANALFAALYVWTGGIANAAEGSFADAFYFSIQTMGTIGYGAMVPVGTAANLVVVAESMTGILVVALSTGLVFAKFSRPTARVVFSHEAVVHFMNGTPTLSFRLGNARGNQLVDVRIQCVVFRTEVTNEGTSFYRSVDLPLSRGHALSLSRSWTVMHVVDPRSPFHAQTHETLEAGEVELHVLLVGMDDTTSQTVFASHIYYPAQILWQRRHADVLSTTRDGALLLDLRRFHDTEAVA